MYLLNVSLSLLTELAAVAHPAEGHFLRAAENMVKFVILQDGIVGLILLNNEGQNLYPRKLRLNEKHQLDPFYRVKCVCHFRTSSSQE
jgi:hypothetical protein